MNSKAYNSLVNAKIGDWIKIGKYKFRVNRHTRENWKDDKQYRKMLKEGYTDIGAWGTVIVKGIPYCSCATYNDETDEIGLAVFSELDPGFCFIGGEGHLFENGKFDEFDPKFPNAFAYCKNFNYKLIVSNGYDGFTFNSGKKALINWP